MLGWTEKYLPLSFLVSLAILCSIGGKSELATFRYTYINICSIHNDLGQRL